MAKKKKIDIKQVIAGALEHYHKMKPSIKDSTKRQNESLLSEFYRFVDTLPARDRTMKIFSQKGLNRYKEYLIDKMNSTKTDGKKRRISRRRNAGEHGKSDEAGTEDAASDGRKPEGT